MVQMRGQRGKDYGSRQLSQEPWVLAGDFNIIADLSESTSYNGTQRMTMETKEFNECLQQLEVLDHAYNGPIYTWSNR